MPAWLNDPTMYHNRGDSTFTGEYADYGDFVGLDDLFTEQPEVVAGHGRTSTRLGRLRHRRLPHRHRQAREHGVLAAVLAGDPSTAAADGNADFFMFGEVYDADPAFMSRSRRRASSGDARLRVPGRGASASRQGKADDRPARPLRRRRLLHRRRLQRLRAADLPRQPRHGPGRQFLAGGGTDRQPTCCRDRARPRADVPDPRPAGRLLRRRAGLHRRRRRQGRPAGHVRRPRSPHYHDDDRDRHRRGARRRDYDTSAPVYRTSPRSPRCGRRTRRSPTAPRSTATPPTAPASSRSAGSTRGSQARVPRRAQQRRRPPRPRPSTTYSGTTRRSRRSTAARDAARPTATAGSR